MRHSGKIALLAIVICAGCQRDAGSVHDDTGRTSDSGAATQSAQRADEAVATAVQRWDCGAMSLTTKYLPRDRAISLGLHEGERKLPRVPSASGEKYQEGPIMFWRKGGTAMYERAPAPPVDCRLSAG